MRTNQPRRCHHGLFAREHFRAAFKDLIVIQSTLNQTTVAQLSVGDAAELIQLHSTEVKDLFVNAYWRTLGLEGRALALNAILPEELLPATADPIEDLNEWMETAEGWATLIYESCASPSGILILGSSPSFGKLFESLNPAFESADLPVPVMISTGPSLAQGLEKLEQANAPILTLEACGEDLWASLIREDGVSRPGPFPPHHNAVRKTPCAKRFSIAAAYPVP